MKFSVIVPVYNTEAYLEKCLYSLLNQTYSDIEILAIDDGSTDHSLSYLKKLAKKYPNKLKVHHKENTGLSDTRNYGVKKANGDYLLFIDSDDYVDVHLCEELARTIKASQADLVKFQFVYVRDGVLVPSGEQIQFDCNGEEAFRLLTTEKLSFEMACIYAYRRAYWLEHEFHFKIGTYHEDFGLIPFVIVSAKRVISISKAFYFYVERTNSIVNNRSLERLKKRMSDLFVHYDYLMKEINQDVFSSATQSLFHSYLANAILSAYWQLPISLRQAYRNEIKSRKIIDCMNSDTLFRFFKKELMKVKFYVSR